MQTDMFAEPAPPPVAVVCGTCVHRNAPAENWPTGTCTPRPGVSHGDQAPGCDQHFPLTQLYAACARKR